jgi:5-enolpyruvylshikimate-3-phosphate synthase
MESLNIKLNAQDAIDIMFEPVFVDKDMMADFAIVKNLFAGESGFASRLFVPIAALHNSEKVLNGTGTLLNRPFFEFDAYLNPFGVENV